MKRGGIGRCDTYYDLLESHGRTDRGSKIEGQAAGGWGLVASGWGWPLHCHFDGRSGVEKSSCRMGLGSWQLKLLNCKWIMMAAPFYRRGAFLYKTNAVEIAYRNI